MLTWRELLNILIIIIMNLLYKYSKEPLDKWQLLDHN